MPKSHPRDWCALARARVVGACRGPGCPGVHRRSRARGRRLWLDRLVWLGGLGGGDLEHPEGVAVNDATGDVYVADKGNNRIDQFEAGGKFIRAWGWGVVEGIGKKEELQTCTILTGCGPGVAGTGAGQLDAPEAVAVDNSTDASKEDVYVMDNANKVIDKFSAAGVYESQLTGTCEITAVAPPACTGSTFIPFGELLSSLSIPPAICGFSRG